MDAMFQTLIKLLPGDPFRAFLDEFASIPYCGIGLMSLFPELNLDVGAEAFTTTKEFLNAVIYLLPWNTVVAIASLIVTICVFRLTVALIRTIRGFIPTMSS